MANYKIILSGVFFVLVSLVSCERDEERCSGYETIIRPFPSPYENYFASINSSRIWHSNTGLTDNFVCYINLREQARYRREDDELTENCEFVTGLKRYADYFSVLYKDKTFGISLTCDDNNQLTLMLLNGPGISNFWGGVYFKKVINNPNAKLQFFNGYFYLEPEKNFERPVADEDFSIADTVQIGNTVYRNVFVIKSTISKEEGGNNAINKFYIAPFVGVIRFEMNNGEIWSIE